MLTILNAIAAAIFGPPKTAARRDPIPVRKGVPLRAIDRESSRTIAVTDHGTATRSSTGQTQTFAHRLDQVKASSKPAVHRDQTALTARVTAPASSLRFSASAGVRAARGGGSSGHSGGGHK